MSDTEATKAAKSLRVNYSPARLAAIYRILERGNTVDTEATKGLDDDLVELLRRLPASRRVAETMNRAADEDTGNEIERLREERDLWRAAQVRTEAENLSLSRLLAEVEYERDEALGRHE